MEYVERHITYKIMPNESVTVMPIGDAQVGVEAADLKRLKSHVEWGFHTKRKALFLGMGDYVDMASPSNRRTLKAAGLYDTVTEALQVKATEDINTFLSMTKYTQGAWLGLLQGHHYMDMADGSTSDMKIAEALRAPFLGDAAIVRIIFDKHKDVDGLPLKADIWCHHGRGGGVGAAAPISLLEKTARGFDADIYLMGHQHKKVATPIDEMFWSRDGRMLHRTKLLACTGSFLKGYLANSMSEGRAGGTYVEKGMMTPVSLGGIVIELGVVKEEYGDRLDINVSL